MFSSARSASRSLPSSSGERRASHACGAAAPPSAPCGAPRPGEPAETRRTSTSPTASAPIPTKRRATAPPLLREPLRIRDELALGIALEVLLRGRLRLVRRRAVPAQELRVEEVRGGVLGVRVERRLERLVRLRPVALAL